MVVILSFSKKIGSGLNVVWDLDDTLIKSVHLETFQGLVVHHTVCYLTHLL